MYRLTYLIKCASWGNQIKTLRLLLRKSELDFQFMWLLWKLIMAKFYLRSRGTNTSWFVFHLHHSIWTDFHWKNVRMRQWNIWKILIFINEANILYDIVCIFCMWGIVIIYIYIMLTDKCRDFYAQYKDKILYLDYFNKPNDIISIHACQRRENQ